MFTKEEYKAMQDAIDIAWSNPTEEEAKLQRELFPEGKPDVACFLQRMSLRVLTEAYSNGAGAESI